MLVHDVEADLLHSNYFSVAVWSSEGSSYRAPIVDDDHARRTNHELHGVSMQALRTNGDGACGLHALFGEFPHFACKAGEIVCSDARAMVVSKLPSSWEEVSSMVNAAIVLEDLKWVMWHDWIIPFFSWDLFQQDAMFFGHTSEPSREANLFATALSEISSEAFQGCQQDVTGIKIVQEEQRGRREAIADASRRLFVRPNEAGLRELSARLGQESWVAERAFGACADGKQRLRGNDAHEFREGEPE